VGVTGAGAACKEARSSGASSASFSEASTPPARAFGPCAASGAAALAPARYLLLARVSEVDEAGEPTARTVVSVMPSALPVLCESARPKSVIYHWSWQGHVCPRAKMAKTTPKGT
jgi:hypothetical protein